jgi:hypothetical protein
MLTLAKFTKSALSKDDSSSVKGGVFCELYAGYAKTTKQEENPETMNRAYKMDSALGMA